MRVLFTDQTAELGGGELSLLDVVQNLAHPAEVALFADGPFRTALEQVGVRVHVLSLGQAGTVRREAGLATLLGAAPAVLALRKQLADLARNFDVLYANSQKAFLLSAMARHRGQPVVWHLRDMLDAEHFSGVMRKVAVLAGNRAASIVIANSHATRDALVRAGGNPDKVVVVHNGVSATSFEAITDGDIRSTREELGLTGKFVVGVFGRLSPWKGQHVLLEALVGLPDIHAVIVGDALFGEDAYAASLRQRATELGLGDRVRFLGFRRDIAKLMRTVDAIAHTSTAPEPFGRVLVEGMLADKPVIATRAGGALEILSDRDTGLLVTAGDAGELQTALKHLYEDPAEARALAGRGRQRALSAFSVEAMVRGIDAALKQVCAGSAVSR